MRISSENRTDRILSFMVEKIATSFPIILTHGLVGYCGILAYLIWQTAVRKLQKSSVANERAKPSSEVFDESDTEARAVKSKFKLAKKHLAKAIALDPHSFIYIQYTVSVSCLEFDLRRS